MAEQKDWLTVAEIAELTGKQKDYVRRVLCASVRPDQQQQRLSVGRGRPTTEYHVSVLPPDVRLVVRPDAAPLPALLPPKRQQRPEELKDWQQKRWTARVGVVREVHKLEADGVSRHEAIKTLLRYFKGGLMPELLPASRTGSLSVVGVYGLCALYDSGGELALMPADRALPKLRKDDWLPYFLRIWRHRDTGRNGRSIMDTYREMKATLPKNVLCPTYQTVRRYLDKMSSIERNKGRLTGNALKATKGYTKQRPPKWPLDCVFCDGHSFHAYVKHPETGKATILEVCWVVDWATRMPLGFAVGLAESKWTVSGALLWSFLVTEEKRYGGIPLVLKTDGGSGNLSKLIKDQWGLLARAGVQEHQVGEPGDPACQAIIECMNKLLIDAARKFWTYRGEDADADSLRKKVILIDKNEAQNNRELGYRTCTLAKVPTIDDMIKGIAAELNDFAVRREHSELPEYYCTTDRKNKHYTPAQYWQHLVDAGWEQPPAVPQEVLESFQMPREPRVCRRELVQIGNCVYHSAELAGWHGKKVLVERQLWDAQVVKVYDLEGRKICDAQIDGHVKDALALTPLEEYRVKRVEQAVKLKERYIADQRHELDNLLNPPMRSANPVPAQLGGPVATLQRPAKPAPAREPEPPPAPLMPILSGEEFHAQCAAAVDRGEVLSEGDRELLADYYDSAEGQDYLTFGGRNLLE